MGFVGDLLTQNAQAGPVATALTTMPNVEEQGKEK